MTLKIALAAVAILLLGAVTLWTIGGRGRTFHAAVEIDREPHEVFPWLVEPPLLSRWIGGLVESRPLGDGELRVGARSVDVVEDGGRRSEMTTEVTALEPGRLLEVRLQSPLLAGTNRLALERSAAGTRVDQKLTVRYRGATRLFGPFLSGTVRQKLRSDLLRLKSECESGSAR